MPGLTQVLVWSVISTGVCIICMYGMADTHVGDLPLLTFSFSEATYMASDMSLKHLLYLTGQINDTRILKNN